MKKILVPLFIIVSVVSTMALPSFAGSLNNRSIGQVMQVQMPATTSTAPTITKVAGTAISSSTIATIAANGNRLEAYVLNYSSNVLYVGVSVATQTVVDSIAVPAYSTSNSWQMKLPYYTGAYYLMYNSAGQTLGGTVVEYNK